MSDSRVIDSKVVELSLENEKFESNANKSISTLDKLKQGFKFDGVGKDIDTTRVNTNALTAGIKALSGGFNGLQQAASVSIGEIAKIKLVSDAISYVEEKVASLGRTLNDLTFAQVDAGWDKYAEKTSAVQTIMSATAKEFSKEAQESGEQMEYVNGQLQKLNWFTDETSYNFLDMVNNIGKFTNNNVALDRSVTAMQGISTWAAKSGANVGEASRAMYNLSQALSIGSVQTMDWKSIELANMATAEFKETAIQTAEALGLLTKESDTTWKTMEGHEVSVENFREALKDDWFSSEVLLQTLSKYGNFTDKLYEFMDSYSIDANASTILEYIDEYAKNGTLENFDEVAKDLEISSEDLRAALEELSSEELEFGRKAFKAAQEAKTFQEAIDATKDAVSTAWMNTFETLFGDYEKAKGLWTDLANDLWEVFAAPVNNFNEKLQDAFGKTTALNQDDWDKLASSGITSPAYIRAVRDAAAEHGIAVNEVLSDEEWLSNALKDNLLDVSLLNEAYSSLFKGSGSNADQELLSQAQALNETDESFQNLIKSLEGYSAEDIQKVVFGDGAYAEGYEDLEKSVDSVLDALGLTQDDGEKAVEVLKAMGLFGGEAWKNYTDEELKAMGMNDAQIEKFKELQAEGKNFDDILNEIGLEKTSGEDLWTGSLYKGMEAFLNLIETVKEEWSEIFPETTADSIYKFLESLNSGATKLANFTKENKTLKVALRGLFAAFDIVLRVAGGVKDVFIGIVKESGVLNFFSSIITRVANGIIKFREWIVQTDAINKSVRFICNTLKTAKNLVTSWIDSFLKIPFVNNNLQRFRHAFSLAFHDFGPYMSDGIKRFKDFIQRVKDMGGLKKENIGAIFKDFKENVLDYFLNFPGFKSIGSAFSSLAKDVKKHLKAVGDAIWEYFEGLRTKFDGTLAGKVLGFVMDAIASVKNKLMDLAKGSGDGGKFSIKGVFKAITSGVGDFVSFLLGLVKKLLPLAAIALPIIGIIKLIKGAMSLFFSFPKLMNTVKDTIGSIGSYFNAKKQAEQADALWTVAKSIGLLVAAIYVLTKCDTKKLIVATGVLIALAGLLLGVMWAINKMSDSGGDKITGIKDVFDRLTNSVAGFIDAKKTETMTKALRNIALSIGILVASVYVLAQLDTKKMLISVGVIAGLVLLMTGVMKMLSKMDTAKQSVTGALTLIAIATSVGILVKAINDIQVDSSLGAKLLVVLVLLASLTAVAFALSKFTVKGTLKGAITMLAMAVAIRVLVNAVNAIKVDDTLMQRLLVVEVLLGSMAVIAALMSAFKFKMSSGVGLLAMAAAMYVLAKAVTGLADVDPDSLSNAVKVMFELMAMLTVMTAVTSFLRPSLMSIVSLVAIAGIMAVLMAILTALPYDKNLTEKVDAFTKLLLSLSAAVLVLTVAGALGGPATMLSGLAALGTLVLVIGGIAAALAAINAIMGALGISDGFEKAKSFLEPAFEFMSWIMTKVGEVLGSLVGGVLSGATSTLPQVADNINTVIEVLSGLNTKEIDFDGIKEMASAIGKVSWEGFKIGIENFVLNALGGPTTTESFGQAATDVANIITSWNDSLAGVEEVKTFDAEQIKTLAETVTTISDAGLHTAVNDFITNFLSGITGGEGMTATESFAQSADDVTDIIKTWNEKTAELGDINTFDGEQVKSLAETVKTISDAGLHTAVNDFISAFLSSITTGEGMTATESFAQSADDVVGIIKTWNEKTVGIDSINTFPSDQVEALTTTVSEISEAGLGDAINSFITNLLDKIKGGEGETATESFAKAADDVVGIIKAWNEKMADVTEIKGVDPNQIRQMAQAVRAVSNAGLGLAVDNFIKGIIGKITGDEGETAAETFSKAAQTVAELVTAWNEKMADINEIKGVKPSEITQMVNAVKAVSNAGLGEAVTNLKAKVFDILSGGEGDRSAIETFGDSIDDLVTVINTWNEKTSEIGDIHDVDAGKITAMTNAVKAVSNAGLGAAINDFKTKFLDEITGGEGKSSIEHFGEAAEQLATVLTEWQDKLSGLEEITGPPEGAIQTIMDAIDEIPTSGLIDKMKNFLTGDDGKSVETFAKNAGTLGDALVTWKTNMDSLGDYVVESTTLTENIGELQKAFDAVGGEEGPLSGFISSLDAIFGSDQVSLIEDFKKNAINLGEGLSGFLDAIGSDFEVSRFSDISTATAALGEGISGISQLAVLSLGENMEKVNSLFGAIATGFNLLTGDGELAIDVEKFTDISTAADTLAQGVEILSTIKFEGDLTNEDLVSSFATNLDTIKEKIESLTSLDTSGVSKLKGAVSSVSNTDLSGLDQSGEQASEDVGKGIANGISSVTDAMSSVITAATDTISDKYGSFKLKGWTVMNQFASGIQERKNYVNGKVESIVSGAAAVISSYNGAAYTAGGYFVDGFATGIDLKAYVARQAAQRMAEAALEAVKTAIRSKSPSKETQKLGNYFGQGFTMAIDDYQSIAYKSGRGVAEAAKSGLQKSVSIIKNLLSGDIGGDPVIRPVLDLSEIQNGANLIGDMLTLNEPIGVMGNLNAISTNSRYDPNADLLSAINQLGKTLGNGGNGDTYVVNGVTYDDGTNISTAVKSLVQAAKINRRMN